MIKLNKDLVNKIDGNNMKALAIVKMALNAIENGCDDVDIPSILEVVCDYLEINDNIFDTCM
jgi:hypothetical protein